MKCNPIISDGMILQRGESNKIWGTAISNQIITIHFINKTYVTISDQQGNWEIILKDLSPGGPYHMEIIGDEKIILHDIYIGDVWLLGGQSNMELPISRTLDLYEEEVKQVVDTKLHMFQVPQEYNFHGPQNTLNSGTWVAVDPESIMKFSAVGYFFGKELRNELDIPIGLIQTAVGGTPIEAWISEPTLRMLGDYESEIRNNKDDLSRLDTIRKEQLRANQWYQELDESDAGIGGLYNTLPWYDVNYEPINWDKIQIPSLWANTELEDRKGSIWFFKEFYLSGELFSSEYSNTAKENEDKKDTKKSALEKVKLYLGTIVDADMTYVNGHLIGKTDYRYPPRRYTFSKEILKPGKNRICVRVIVNENKGGFLPDMPYYLQINNERISLEGEWYYKVGTIKEPLPPYTFYQYKPIGLYNGMIYPMKDYSIAGFVWYQGESNTNQPSNYKVLFQGLVNDWRRLWQLEDLPFLYVQLANYLEGEETNHNSKWAILREEQRESLSISNTAMAVTIDIGQYNELHPQNKKELGHRLALCAMHVAYDKNVVYSGPEYQSMIQKDNKLYLSFKHIGSGLIVSNYKSLNLQDNSVDELQLFSVCGEDNIFYPARAIIEDNQVIVWSDKVLKPMGVRYGWCDNPDKANLYNREGLPASPFYDTI